METVIIHLLTSKKLSTRSAALAKPVCESEGLELIHVEYQRESGGRILRLYIDKPDGSTWMIVPLSAARWGIL